MKQYRKKPVLVHAVQFYPAPNAPDGVEYRGADAAGPVYVVPTLEGDMRLRPGDWLLWGTRGELYPVKDEIFREIYEDPASEGLPAHLISYADLTRLAKFIDETKPVHVTREAILNALRGIWIIDTEKQCCNKPMPHEEGLCIDCGYPATKHPRLDGRV